MTKEYAEEQGYIARALENGGELYIKMIPGDESDNDNLSIVGISSDAPEITAYDLREIDYICSGAFTDKELSLTKVTFPHTGDKDTTHHTRRLKLAGKCFYGCTSLEEVVFEGYVNTHPGSKNGDTTGRGDGAHFGDCTRLRKVVIKGHKVERLNTILVPSLAYMMFSGCINLHEVVFPYDPVCRPAMTLVPEMCFYCCSGLKKIELPYTITTIQKSAFGFCTTLEAVTFQPNSLIGIIGDKAFEYCVNLHTLVLPYAIFKNYKIHADAFIGSDKLKVCEASAIPTPIFSGVQMMIPEDELSLAFDPDDGKPFTTVKGTGTHKTSGITEDTTDFLPDCVIYPVVGFADLDGKVLMMEDVKKIIAQE